MSTDRVTFSTVGTTIEKCDAAAEQIAAAAFPNGYRLWHNGARAQLTHFTQTVVGWEADYIAERATEGTEA